MILTYKNKTLEKAVTISNMVTSIFVAATFAMLFGFYKQLMPPAILYAVQALLLCIFITEKVVRFFNVRLKLELLRFFWFEIPILLALVVILFGAGRWFAQYNAAELRHTAIGVYLVLQVVIKVCRSVVNMAATGQNPTRILLTSFLVLIFTGAGLLMLPKSAPAGDNLNFVDALFTSTSATCVTGLIVRDTGSRFNFMGQAVIITLIQLGGLGIVIFGAVIALLLGQAFSVRESVAMQDLLSARTLGKIGTMIAFIFFGTLFIEAIGMFSLLGTWDNCPTWQGDRFDVWFYSIFHSISAFCNAGFSLFSKSFIEYQKSWSIYTVICPLIILGGLGFGVLYDLYSFVLDKIKRFFRTTFQPQTKLLTQSPIKLSLQTKIVLTVSLLLILAGTVLLLVFENNIGAGTAKSGGVLGALFQCITARTAGFNTVDIDKLSAPSQFILIILMFIGGSPGSTAGGIKTVTFAVLIMTALAALRKRSEVEIFRRSIRISIVGRAITITLLFIAALFTAGLALTITERNSGFEMSQIFFETASALGTVGLTTGITPSLTTAGKLIIIVVMLIGRLGPLTLLAGLTFNIKPAKYNYPDEAIIVG